MDAQLKAAIVLHDMGRAGDKLLEDFERDPTYEAIVQVNILGEGWDHPYCSIAAVLRPFRSSGSEMILAQVHIVLGPLAQFFGRCLRVIPDSSFSARANIATLLFHQAFETRIATLPGMEDLWADYQSDKEADLAVLDEELLTETQTQKRSLEGGEEAPEAKAPRTDGLQEGDT